MEIQPPSFMVILFYFLLRFYLFIFRRREREGEKHQCVVDSRTPPTGDLARDPGMCPDWELNQQPFALWADAQSTEPHKPGQFSSFDPVTLCPRYTSALYKN